MTTTARFRVKRDTTANWASTTVPLGAGEVGQETDKSGGPGIKIGDGTSLWAALPYSGSAGAGGTTDTELLALGSVTAAADRVPYFDSTTTATVAPFTATGRAIVGAASQTAARTALALGNSATKNTGTTAGTVAAGDDTRLEAGDTTNPQLTAMSGSEHIMVFDPVTGLWYYVLPGVIPDLPSALNTRVGTLESQFAGLGATGGLLNKKTTITTVTNTVTNTALANFTAAVDSLGNPIPIADKDTLTFSAQGAIVNTSGASANLTFRWKLNGTDVHFYNTLAIPSATGACYMWRFDAELTIASGAGTAHSQTSNLLITASSTNSGAVTTGTSLGTAPLMDLWAVNFPGTIDITTSVPSCEWRCFWGTQAPTLSCAIHNATWSLIKGA